MGKRVFIAGADGFVGSMLARALTSKGYEVHGGVYVRAPGERETRVDVSRPDSFGAIPPGDFDAVINNAGVVDQSTPTRIMFAVNAEGTRNTLAWARSRNCRHFIQVSSISVVGLKAMGQNRSEDRAKRSLYLGVPYQRSKAKGEAYVESSGLPFTILRLPSVLGSGDTIITPAIGASLKDGSYFRCGNKDPLLSIINVRDFPDMVDKVLQRGPDNAIYNASSHHLPWSAIVAEYAAALGTTVPPTRKPLLSMLTHMHDKLYLYLLTNSRFGAHFPSDRFFSAHDYQPVNSWQQGVAEAVAGMS